MGAASLRLLVDIDQSVEWTLIATIVIAVCVVLLTAFAILRI